MQDPREKQRIEEQQLYRADPECCQRLPSKLIKMDENVSLLVFQQHRSRLLPAKISRGDILGQTGSL